MTWYYKGKPLEEIPEKTIGFVYCITNKLDGRCYFGKKLFWFSKTKQVKGKKKKTNIWSVLFVFLLLIIIVVALMVVFKDEARPIWEWLLYSREERELLRQMGQGL